MATSLIGAAVTAGAALWVVIGTFRMVVMCWNALPVGDQWAEVVSGRSVDWTWLSSQHLEHRILFPRLVFWADFMFARETNILNEAVILVIQCGMVAVLLRLAARAGLTTGIARIWTTSLCVALIFWAGQYQNFVWGFQVQFVGVLLAAAGTFATLALARQPAVALGGAIAIESIGVYTLASGALIPPLAVLLAIGLRRPKRHVALLAAVAALLLASYLWGYHTPPESSDPFSAWHAVRSIVLYLLVALGAPIANVALLHTTLIAGIGVSAAAGVLGLYAICRLAFGMVRPGASQLPAEAALLALAGFVVGMFTITAAGRIRFGITSALVSRYTSPAMVFWCCLVLLLASRVARSGRTTAYIQGGAMALSVLMAVTEADNTVTAQNWASMRRAATPAILAGVTDADVLATVYAPINGPGGGPIAAMRRAGTSVFADPWATWLGTALSHHVAGFDSSRCGGSLGHTEQVTTKPVAGFRVTGHAWLTGSGRPIEKLVITDASGTIIGGTEGSGGTTIDLTGGRISGLTIASGGTLIYAGGIASGLVASAGAIEVVASGFAATAASVAASAGVLLARQWHGQSHAVRRLSGGTESVAASADMRCRRRR